MELNVAYLLVNVQHGGETLKGRFAPLKLGQPVLDWRDDGVQVGLSFDVRV